MGVSMNRGSLSDLLRELIAAKEEIAYWRVKSSMVSHSVCSEVFNEVVEYLSRCIAKTERLVSMVPEIIEALEFLTEYVPNLVKLCKELVSAGCTHYSTCSRIEEGSSRALETFTEILNDIEKHYRITMRYVRVLKGYAEHLENMESMHSGICLELESILVELRELYRDLDERIRDIQKRLDSYYTSRKAALKLVTLVHVAREEILKELEESRRRKPTWQRVL